MPRNIATTTVEKMKVVKAACDKAPNGSAKTRALAHYAAAETAHAARDDVLAVQELDAARHVLS